MNGVSETGCESKSDFERFLREKGYSSTGIREMIQRIDEDRADRIDRYELEEYRDAVRYRNT